MRYLWLLIPLLVACDVAKKRRPAPPYKHTDAELGLTIQYARNLMLRKGDGGENRFTILYPNYKGISPTMTLETRPVSGDAASTADFAAAEMRAWQATFEGSELTSGPDTVQINGRFFVSYRLKAGQQLFGFYYHVDTQRSLGLTFKLMDTPGSPAMAKFVQAVKSVRLK